MFFKLQKFPENFRADFLELFIQVSSSATFLHYQTPTCIRPLVYFHPFHGYRQQLQLICLCRQVPEPAIQRANNDNVTIFPAVHQLEDSRIWLEN